MLLYALLVCAALTSIYEAKLPEEDLTVPELIRYWGYPAESHIARTEDGYLLTLHRIPHGKKGRNNKSKQKKRPVFFLQHGLLCSSSNWVTNLPGQSLGFMLADAGYDVWMGNNRGNTYSQKHETLSSTSEAFWDFSFEEMAAKDLPAMVDLALNVTGQKQLFYVGHSEGTMMIFAGLSENKALNKKIKTAFALAPVARLGAASSPITYLSYLESGLGVFFDVIGVRDFMPSAHWVRTLADLGCSFNGAVCENFLFLIAGSDERNMNVTRTPVYLTHTPAGTSVKNMLHFCQLVEDDRFQKYDYGYFGNMKRYHSLSPPSYPLKNIETELVLFSGGSDTLADPKDVRWLRGELSTVFRHYEIPKFNHLDFIWGESARNQVYKEIVRIALKRQGIN